MAAGVRVVVLCGSRPCSVIARLLRLDPGRLHRIARGRQLSLHPHRQRVGRTTEHIQPQPGQPLPDLRQRKHAVHIRIHPHDHAARKPRRLLAPRGTPLPIVKRLHAEVVGLLKQPAVRYRLLGYGAEPVGNTPEEFRAFIEAEIAKWGKIIRAAGLTAS